MKKIILLAPDNGVGLSRDRLLLAAVLREEGFEVSMADGSSTPRPNEVPDLAIHLEIVRSHYLKKGCKNILIPNPEWFLSEWIKHLPSFDTVMCKTEDAESIFKSFGANTVFTGFTSFDRYQPEVQKKKTNVHLQGKSSAKGTMELIKAFASPDMPTLTVLTQHQPAPRSESDNVMIIPGYVDEQTYRRLQNEALIQWCPSIYEGFGHYMNEAMSCGAVVITTNGAPMSELMGKRGCFAVGYNKTGRQQLAITKIPDVTSIIEMSAIVNNLSLENLVKLGGYNRELFLERDAVFRGKFLTLIHETVG